MSTESRGSRVISRHLLGCRWSFTFSFGNAMREAFHHERNEVKEKKKWQAHLWVRKDETQEAAQEVVFSGLSLHSLRLSAQEWLEHEHPCWLSNVSPTEMLNGARKMQRVVIRGKRMQQGYGIGLAGKRIQSATNRSRTESEPEITEEMVRRYPHVFPEPRSETKALLEADDLHETPVATTLVDRDILCWLRDGEGAKRELTPGVSAPEQFGRFEDAIAFFLLHDFLPERGPDFYEDSFSTDRECYAHVETIHQEDNECLINDYLSRGWFYNGQLRGKVAPHHTTGDGPLIILLYHSEPLAR